MAKIKQPKKARTPWTPWGKWLKARREKKERKRFDREQRRMERQRRREQRQMRRRRFLARGGMFIFLLLFACGIGFIVLLLLGKPYPWQSVRDVAELLTLSENLDVHRARWGSLGISHYTVEVEYRAGEVWCGPTVIEVDDGKVVEPPSPKDTHWYPVDDCNAMLDTMMIDEAFTWLSVVIEGFFPGDTYIRADFNPDFGYPVYAEFGSYAEENPGMLWSITWSSLQPLNP